MTLTEAYEMVYDDLINNCGGMLRGKIDLRHSNDKFASGIETVMEVVAAKAGKEEEFSNIWFDNYLDSLFEII